MWASGECRRRHMGRCLLWACSNRWLYILLLLSGGKRRCLVCRRHRAPHRTAVLTRGVLVLHVAMQDSC